MNNPKHRREFLRQMALYTMGAGLLPSVLAACNNGASTKESKDSTNVAGTSGAAAAKELFFKISLAEWSFHDALFSGKLNHLDFPAKAKNDFGIEAVEYVNQFFKDKATDKAYLADLKKRCSDNGVRSVLIMIDGEGEMGDLDVKKRTKAVENHYKWVEAAEYLGCHAIRVNAAGEGKPDDVSKAVIESLAKLSGFANTHNISVIVENHGGSSSNGKWLSNVMKQVNMPNCGTLPDFGNFCLNRTKPVDNTPQGWAATKCLEEYDRYEGVTELMPFAKGVSAKTHDFDAEGNCIETDYRKMLKIVKDAGYTGHIGIEYEGTRLSEEEGVRKTLELLKKVGAEIS
ncbi:sugar phosphate isomerase/epimerase family protein [Chitinophaga pinensis]|uniref:Xylose isomerase domain protein TIM barrel n=1 Tax=Chitinophaga pinensis (strain ATCC 43595 / DSM 2588 / LMG 13176 / NBRC 15968 / NCIMB 11800 / UQM 2034) TaxID=485918 RepID=A0A979GAQ2_CHIPD|nr:sugar phosphate isomerase/epimerase family protein [Chitinophaga pinensis]ACU63863.1 Xylose isomerase domain protein TIM barrel [Chitinophaga pinensis DSM 2588]